MDIDHQTLTSRAKAIWTKTSRAMLNLERPDLSHEERKIMLRAYWSGCFYGNLAACQWVEERSELYWDGWSNREYRAFAESALNATKAAGRLDSLEDAAVDYARGVGCDAETLLEEMMELVDS